MAGPGRRLPTAVWVVLAIAAATGAAAAGVVAGSAADDDRDETTVERVSSTTSPAAGGAAPPTTTTTTAPVTADGLLPDGFYVVLASESDDEAGRARLAERAADIDGAQVTSTSSYDSLPAGDDAIGQAPDHLPAAGVSVLVVGPMALEEAQERCAGEFGGDCSVRQLRAG